MSSSPKVAARLAFAFNFLSAVPAGFSVSILQKSFVPGDPAATAARILGSEPLFRLGWPVELTGILIFLGAPLMLYQLFKPAGRGLALFMLIFMVVGTGIQALDTLPDMAALSLLQGGKALASLGPSQAQDLAYVVLRLHSSIYLVALVFYGAGCFMIASLVFRSAFLPRILWVFPVIEGLGYFTFSFVTFLSPAFAAHLRPFVPFGTAAIGELPLYLWLLVKTVNVERWNEQAAASA